MPDKPDQEPLGAMREAADELDEAVEDAMRMREARAWQPSREDLAGLEAIAGATGRTITEVLADAIRIYRDLYAWRTDPQSVVRAVMAEEVDAPAEGSLSYRQAVMDTLGRRMSHLSESATCAGWMSDLEEQIPILCEAAIRTGRDQPFGAIEISPMEAARLLAFRAVLGHWVVPAIQGGYEPYLLQEDIAKE